MFNLDNFVSNGSIEFVENCDGKMDKWFFRKSDDCVSLIDSEMDTIPSSNQGLFPIDCFDQIDHLKTLSLDEILCVKEFELSPFSIDATFTNKTQKLIDIENISTETSVEKDGSDLVTNSIQNDIDNSADSSLSNNLDNVTHKAMLATTFLAIMAGGIVHKKEVQEEKNARYQRIEKTKYGKYRSINQNYQDNSYN